MLIDIDSLHPLTDPGGAKRAIVFPKKIGGEGDGEEETALTALTIRYTTI